MYFDYANNKVIKDAEAMKIRTNPNKKKVGFCKIEKGLTFRLYDHTFKVYGEIYSI